MCAEWKFRDCKKNPTQRERDEWAWWVLNPMCFWVPRLAPNCGARTWGTVLMRRKVFRYSKNMLKELWMVEIPTVVVTVTLATPLTGLTQVSVLPAQKPLPGPVWPRVPNAVSS